MTTKRHRQISSITLIFTCLAILTACNNAPKPGEPLPAEEKGTSRSGKLISCESMLAILQQKSPNYKIIDIREAKAYRAGHIPGAISTWRADYEDMNHKTEGLMADKAQMESLLRNWGITAKDTLILYDEKGNTNACRLWWILLQYGFENVKILDGSYVKWQQAGYPTDSIRPEIQQSGIQLQDPQPRFFADMAAVETHLTQKGVLLDSRTLEEYNGSEKKGGVKHGGHIPGAIRFDWSEVVKAGDEEDCSFRDIKSIGEKLQAIQVGSEDDIIVYCQSGVRSACVAFALTELLGYKKVRNYDGSWLEWGNSEKPVVAGDNPL